VVGRWSTMTRNRSCCVARKATATSQTGAFSIGLDLREDGVITDTTEGMPAALAGIGPGMKLVAVNSRQYTPEVLRDALKAGRTGTAPLELLVENTDYYKTYKLDLPRWGALPTSGTR